MLETENLIAELPRHLFWDVRVSSLDAREHGRFIIARVMERGSSTDVRRVWHYYGEAKIKEALTTAPALSRRTISFFAHQFQIPREDFRAFHRAQNWTP